MENIGILVDHKLALDLGCGSCEFIYYLQQYTNINAVGIDIQKYIIAASKMIASIYGSNLNIALDTGYELPFKNNVFDLVFLLDVIEHVDNPYKFLSEVKRALKPGGFCVILFPPYFLLLAGTPIYHISIIYQFLFVMKYNRTNSFIEITI